MIKSELDKIKERCEKATPMNLSSAEIKEQEDFVCPACEGEGAITGDLYINYDNQALNVLFTGIGDTPENCQAFYQTARSDILKLVEALEVAMEGLQAVKELTDGEIKIRFHSNRISEAENAGKSKIYSLLSMPRNLSRDTLTKINQILEGKQND